MIVPTRKSEGGSGVSPDGKKSKGDDVVMSSTEKFDKMFDMITDIQKDIGQTKLIAQTAVQTAEMAMDSVNAIKTNINQLHNKDISLEREITAIKQLLTTPSTNTQPSGSPFGDREVQVIVEGLKDTQDEDEIIKQVQTVVDGLGGNGKYIKIGTFSDPSRVGVVQFRSVAAKIGFLRRSNLSETKWTNGETMRFKSNDTIEKRTTDKTLGMIKYHLHNKKGYELKDINIKWRNNVVEYRGKEMAWVTEAGEVKFDSSITDIDELVTASINDWKDKRGLA